MEFVNFSFWTARQLGSKQTMQFFFGILKIVNIFHFYVTYYYCYIPLMKTIFHFIFWCRYHNTKYKEYYLVPTWCWRWDWLWPSDNKNNKIQARGCPYRFILIERKLITLIHFVDLYGEYDRRLDDPLLSDLISSFSERSVTRIRVFW